MKSRQAKLLLVDDHEVVRAGVRAILQARKDWHIAEATNGKEAVRLAVETRPDVVLLDLELGGMDGVAVTRKIKEHSPHTEILIFTMHDNEYLIREVLSAGARAFVLKSEGGHRLIRAIECVMQHKPFVAGRASVALLNHFRASRTNTHRHSRLTDRECEIVQLLATGSSNKEAARKLGISVKTVETHRAAIMRKLGFSSVVKLVRYAVRERLITQY